MPNHHSIRSISLLALMLFLYSFSAVAQVNKVPVENAGTYFNGFQNSENVDSLMYFSRKLAANPRYIGILQDLLNNEFAQEFIRSEPLTTDAAGREKASVRLKRSKLLLNRMAFDTSKALAKAVQPLFFWTQVQDSENNTEQQGKFTNSFLSAGLAAGDVYQNRAGRYALLIWQLISKKPELKTLTDNLFDSVSRQLKEHQVIVGLDTASRVELDKRAWYRYLYAYSSNARAKGFLKQGIAKGAESLYKTAFDYSPDLTDRNH